MAEACTSLPAFCQHVQPDASCEYAGQISSQGALQFKVLPNSTSADGQVRVSVSRIAIDPERQLPGEAVVLKTLQNALRCARDHFALMYALLLHSGP